MYKNTKPIKKHKKRKHDSLSHSKSKSTSRPITPLPPTNLNITGKEGSSSHSTTSKKRKPSREREREREREKERIREAGISNIFQERLKNVVHSVEKRKHAYIPQFHSRSPMNISPIPRTKSPTQTKSIRNFLLFFFELFGAVFWFFLIALFLDSVFNIVEREKKKSTEKKLRFRSPTEVDNSGSLRKKSGKAYADNFIYGFKNDDKILADEDIINRNTEHVALLMKEATKSRT